MITLPLAALVILISLASGDGAAWAAPAQPAFGPAIDPLPFYDRQSTCDPSAKPGAVALQNLLERNYPSTSSLGIGRACGASTCFSEHKEGRAFDWAVNAFDPAQKAMAQDFLTWLLATDQYGNSHAMARRMGVMYIIWNHHIWKAYAPELGWQPYSPDPNRPCPYSPHTDHVHFSLSRDGGNAATSWYYPNGDWAATRAPAVRGNGYWLPTDRGLMFPFAAPSYGGLSALRAQIVGAVQSPTGVGYWQVAADGGIFAVGGTPFFGSAGGLPLNRPIVGMAPTPTGRGYWLVASDGGIFAYGDAPFLGSTGHMRLNQPVVGMARTVTGRGYWMVASDGGIFSFGDAGFLGSTGNIRLNRPIVGMTPTPTGRGYAMVANDGGIFTFGDAPFSGSAAGIGLNFVGIASYR